VSPVKRIGVSGGTAPFFSLLLKDRAAMSETDGQRYGDYWIGKDLSRAMDE
ncbi:HCc2, partial [Symbiodinium pilosum]